MAAYAARLWIIEQIWVQPDFLQRRPLQRGTLNVCAQARYLRRTLYNKFSVCTGAWVREGRGAPARAPEPPAQLLPVKYMDPDRELFRNMRASSNAAFLQQAVPAKNVFGRCVSSPGGS